MGADTKSLGFFFVSFSLFSSSLWEFLHWLFDIFAFRSQDLCKHCLALVYQFLGLFVFLLQLLCHFLDLLLGGPLELSSDLPGLQSKHTLVLFE